MFEVLRVDVIGRHPVAGYLAGRPITEQPVPQLGGLQPRQHRLVDGVELVGVQHLGAELTPIDLLGQPLGGGSQGCGQRVARRDRVDVVLRVHAQHHPGVPAVGHRRVLFDVGVVGSTGILAGSDRDDIDAVQPHVELAQPRGQTLHRQGRLCGAAVPAGSRRGPPAHRDDRHQPAFVFADPDRLPAEAPVVIDCGATAAVQGLFRVGELIGHPSRPHRADRHPPVGEQREKCDQHRHSDARPPGVVSDLRVAGPAAGEDQDPHIDQKDEGDPYPRQVQT